MIDQNDETNVKEDEFVSKTQLKNEAKHLQQFARQLINLPSPKVQQLPLNDTTQIAIADYHKQSGNIARKRHLAYIGKCLRHDNAKQAEEMLEENLFASTREKQLHDNDKTDSSEKKNSAEEELINLLLENTDQQIEILLEADPDLSRQTMRQLIRNVVKAKTEQKKTASLNKLSAFLKSNKLS